MISIHSVQSKVLWNLGEYSCLRTKLLLRREYSYYLIQLYIPSFMLVVVSWVSFWLDKDAVPARVSLGVTTLLTMTTQASGVNAKLPPVSYTKAVDVWIGVCLAFIFGALLEFALVNYAGRMEFLEKERQTKKQKEDATSLAHSPPPPPVLLQPPTPSFSLHPTNQLASNMTPKQSKTPEPAFRPPVHTGDMECPECEAEQQHDAYRHLITRPLVSSPLDFPSNAAVQFYKAPKKRTTGCWCLTSWFAKYKERSKRIDVISRIVFPFGFFFFNSIYWVAYLM